MRILFDPVVYDMRNKGNIALLQTAVTRVHNMWPNASLDVITLAPHLLRLYCPDTNPVNPDSREKWSNNKYENIYRYIPRSIWRSMFELREEIWRRWPLTTHHMLLQSQSQGISGDQKIDNINGRKNGDQENNYKVTCLKLFNDIDLYVAPGAQYMSDATKDDALRVLDRLEIAAQLGIPTAMVGQGFGPIEDTQLLSRSKAVLPLVDLILVREKLVAPQLLTSFGVDPNRVHMTGDDAIEMAYQARKVALGTDIGVSLRIAHYTEVENKHIEILHSVLIQSSVKYKAKLISIPISHSAHELDANVIRKMIAGNHNIYDDWRRFDTPLEVIRKVGRCRLVITGTFHAAVFALAQGIPAIGLAKSSMYMDKFLGLRDLFGTGCQIVYLDDERLQEKLAAAIDIAWKSAQDVRPHLLEAAARQIELGHRAYQQIYELVVSEYKVSKVYSAITEESNIRVSSDLAERE